MNRAKMNYVVDFFLFVSFFIVSLTGVLLFFGIKGKHGMADMHDWSGMVMIVLSMIHLVLHRNWIVSMTKNFFEK